MKWELQFQFLVISNCALVLSDCWLIALNSIFYLLKPGEYFLVDVGCSGWCDAHSGHCWSCAETQSSSCQISFKTQLWCIRQRRALSSVPSLFSNSQLPLAHQLPVTANMRSIGHMQHVRILTEIFGNSLKAFSAEKHWLKCWRCRRLVGAVQS